MISTPTSSEAPHRYFIKEIAYPVIVGEGDLVKIDQVGAKRIFDSCSLLDECNRDYALAYCYEKGAGVKQDLKEASRLYSLASRQGHPYAKGRLAQQCQREKRLKEAFDLYEEAASLGDDFAKFQLAGFFYMHGIFRDKKSGIEVMGVNSSELENYEVIVAPTSKAEEIDGERRRQQREDDKDGNKLREILESTSGNPQEILFLSNKLANRGNALGQYHLARLYKTGIEGVIEVDHNKAFNLCLMSSLQGSGFAKYDLAQHYEHGIGTERNYDRAIELYKESHCTKEEDKAWVCRVAKTEYDEGNTTKAVLHYAQALAMGSEYARADIAEQKFGGRFNISVNSGSKGNEPLTANQILEIINTKELHERLARKDSGLVGKLVAASPDLSVDNLKEILSALAEIPGLRTKRTGLFSGANKSYEAISQLLKTKESTRRADGYSSLGAEGATVGFVDIRHSEPPASRAGGAGWGVGAGLGLSPPVQVRPRRGRELEGLYAPLLPEAVNGRN